MAESRTKLNIILSFLLTSIKTLTNKITVATSLNTLYPIGSIIHITKTKEQYDPNKVLGGTWRQLEGVFLFGCDSNHIISSALINGGFERITLTINEIPSHSHNYVEYGHNYSKLLGTPGTPTFWMGIRTNSSSLVGGSQPHNNMPPYKNVAIWERIA